MPKATWNEAVIAQSELFETVEGNTYFPSASVRVEYLRPSETHTICRWKGMASYYDVVVNGKVNRDAAWYYPEPTAKAQNIKDHIAFWRGVAIEQ
ncbi:MAG: DUF427 domain-containing protein [Betaproteobacteria bacterium]|nr:DUF427 domain-containing protein [Betaproteobacteria bacterium]